MNAATALAAGGVVAAAGAAMAMGSDATADGAPTERREGEGERRERRSRDRYGRDRRERGERAERSPQDAAQGEFFEQNKEVAVTESARGATEFVASEQLAQAPVPAYVAAPVSAPVAAPAAVAKAGMPKIGSFSLPVSEMDAVATGAGLQWVNSNAERIAAVKAQIAAEPKPIHIPRERPPAVQLDDGPLILVETKRDLRNMTLPFEQAAQQQ
jgi:ribonuclease E